MTIWTLARRTTLALLLACWATSAAAIPVVPGGYGYGMDTRAAYACGSNPTIYRVTSLSDDGSLGTFRYALEQSGPRIVVFEISGYITLTSSIIVTSPCLTVAGQTAPNPGITVRSSDGFSGDKSLYIATHDVLWQHFAIRPGATSCNSGVQLYTGSPYNVVFDHMSVSWAQDENIGIQGPANDVTFWRTISSEGLFQVAGSSGCSGGGRPTGTVS